MPDNELEPTPSRLDRRAAMKAALAGVAAAAVWQAPRIEGLSVAPDVAQAQSCTSGSATPVRVDAIEFNIGLALDNGWCWSVPTSANSCDGTRTVELTVPGNNFTASVVLSGYAWANRTENNGEMAVTVSGIDPPFQSCVFSVDTAASGCLPTPDNAFFSAPSALTFNGDGLQTIPDFGCNVGGALGRLDGAFVTVNLSCVCAD